MAERGHFFLLLDLTFSMPPKLVLPPLDTLVAVGMGPV